MELIQKLSKESFLGELENKNTHTHTHTHTGHTHTHPKSQKPSEETAKLHQSVKCSVVCNFSRGSCSNELVHLKTPRLIFFAFFQQQLTLDCQLCKLGCSAHKSC